MEKLQVKSIEGRYADTIKNEMSEAVSRLGAYAKNEETVLSYVLFPQIAEKFFKEREEKKALVAKYTIREVE